MITKPIGSISKYTDEIKSGNGLKNSNIANESSIDDQNLLLEVVIDLGEGEGDEDIIKVYSKDKITSLVDSFCKKHNLDETVKPKIVEQIEEKLLDTSMQSIHLRRDNSDYSSANITDEENEILKKMPHEFDIDDDCQSDKASDDKRLPENFVCGIKGNEYYDETPIKKPNTILKKSNTSIKENIKTIKRKSSRHFNTIIETKEMIDRLLKYGVYKKTKQDKLRNDSFYLNSAQFKFSPSINKKYYCILINRSIALINTRNNIINSEHDNGVTPNKFLELFEDSKKREAYHKSIIKHNYDSNCTFKPNIHLSQQKVPTKISIKNHVCCDSVNKFCRFQEFEFKPKIGRPQKTERNPNKKPIGEYLYDMATIPRNKTKDKNQKRQQMIIKYKRKLYEDAKKTMEKLKFNEYKNVCKSLYGNNKEEEIAVYCKEEV